MYQNGKGVQQDDAEAIRWYLKAAQQGHADAQNNLGLMYQNGKGVKQDDAEAIKWYLKAAEQGMLMPRIILGGYTRMVKELSKMMLRPSNGISRRPNRVMLLPSIIWA